MHLGPQPREHEPIGERRLPATREESVQRNEVRRGHGLGVATQFLANAAVDGERPFRLEEIQQHLARQGGW